MLGVRLVGGSELVVQRAAVRDGPYLVYLAGAEPEPVAAGPGDAPASGIEIKEWTEVRARSCPSEHCTVTVADQVVDLKPQVGKCRS